jgi:hypothetical protein
MSAFLAVIVISGIFSGIVGTFIDGERGFLWGFFLGPIGWLIAAVLKNGRSQQINLERAVGAIEKTNTVHLPVEKNKWEILKEVDQDIRSASDEVIEIDPELDAVLAEKFLALNQKEYLRAIVESIKKSKTEELEREKHIIAQQLEMEAEIERKLKDEHQLSSAHEMDEYRKILIRDNYDYRYAARCIDIKAYYGSVVDLRGGIVVFFEDGRTLLTREGRSRVFAVGDESWK